MKYLSVCSGIEAVTVAWGPRPLRWKPVGFAEIEPFPCEVLDTHYSTIPNYGDLTKYKEWTDELGTVDLVVGGTPCQSFSVAGLRKGMDDPRGNLALVFLGLVDTVRPRWVVWENVPGVLSSGEGRDFGAFLGGLGQLGYGWAYRVLDAQYVRVDGYQRAVPQRRRRVFVVGHLGDWRRAAAVLFEQACLSGNPAPRRTAGQRVAPGVTVGPPFSRTGNDRIEAEAMMAVCPALTGSGRGVERTGESRGQDPLVPEINPSLNARDSKGSLPSRGIGPPVIPSVAQPVRNNVYNNSDAGMEARGLIAHTLRAEHDASEDGTGRGTPIVSLYSNESRCDNILTDGASVPVKVGSGGQSGNPPAVAIGENIRGEVVESDCARSLASGGGKPGQGRTGMTVRRLTPRECERLQGFQPDDYTRIPWRGKPASECPDGPRYKALGNSMAVNVMRWIGHRIQMVEQTD